MSKVPVEEMLASRLDSRGHEIPDPTPMSPPLGYSRQPTMVDHIRAMVRSELLRREVEAAGYETFEEADDFEVSDDPIDPNIPYEEKFEPEVPVDRPSADPLAAPSPPPAPVAPVSPPPAAPLKP